MERRHVSLDDDRSDQLQLPLANPPLVRRKVNLEGMEAVTLRVQTDPPGMTVHHTADGSVPTTASPPLPGRAGMETVTLRVSKEAAAAIERAGERAVVGYMGSEAKRLLELDKMELAHGPLTEWSRQRPPSTGYWELRQISAQAPDAHNWWYSARLNAWHRAVPQRVDRNAQVVSHATLMQSHTWRGRRTAFPAGYDYELEQQPFGPGEVTLLGPDVNRVAVLGKLELNVTQVGGAPPDRNPNARRKVSL